MTIETANADGSITLAGQIVCAYVQNNPLQKSDLPGLFSEVHRAIKSAVSGADVSGGDTPGITKPTPAEIKKSITPDALISFIDGKPYKTLRRHLRSHNLDDYAYRERYGLPRDYPMVSAGYTERRSALAKQIGLGQPRTQPA